jgi:ATPase subunit of ABC transporter with duplicated ATPase domains
MPMPTSVAAPADQVLWAMAEGLAENAPVPTVPARQGRRARGMKQVLALSHARKSYDGKVVLDGVTLAFLPGAKIGVGGRTAWANPPCCA